MPNNIDGIKKLSGEELRKSRKMVLDYIGEEDKSKEIKKNLINSKKSPKTMDGIRVSKKKISPIFKQEKIKKKFNNKEFLDTMKAKEGGINNKFNGAPREESDKKKIDIKKAKSKDNEDPSESSGQAELEKEAEKERLSIIEKEKEEKEILRIKKVFDDKEKLEEERRVKIEKEFELKKKKKERENASKKLNKKKKASLKNKIKLEAKKRKEEVLGKKLAKLKRKRLKKQRERKKRRKELKEKIAKKITSIITYFKDSYKRVTQKGLGNFLLYLFTFLLSFLLLIYIIFSLILLRMNPSSSAIEKIARYIPVPALVSKEGFLSYREYEVLCESREDCPLGETLLLKRLAKRYNLKIDNKELPLFKEILGERLINDREINRVSFMKVEDIEKAISSGLKFSAVREKYGDEKGILDVDSLVFLKDDIKSLGIGEISEVINTSRGNYVIERNSNFDYIRVDNINLDEYLEQEISKLNFLLLVK